MVIQSERYRKIETQLESDPYVQALAANVIVGIRDGLNLEQQGILHKDGTPQFNFYRAANEEYQKLRDLNQFPDGVHVGAIGNAVMSIVRKRIAI